jgi:hypothetical protein
VDRQGIKNLIRTVAGPNIPFADHDQWVGFPCVFAPYKHASGKDSKPSAGVSVHASGTSIFRCYTCTTPGVTLEWFLKELDRYTGEVPASLIRDAADEEFYGGRLQEWGARDRSEMPATLAEPLDKETYLDLYDEAHDHPYVKFRGISARAGKRLQLLYDPSDSEGDERILFPVFAPNGDLHGFTGRAIHSDARLKVRDYHGLKKSLLLLGSHLIDPRKDKYVLLVEGLFDYAMMVNYGLPAVASMMAALTKAQADILKTFGLPVYSMYDNDKAGDNARRTMKELLCRHIPVLKTRFPRVKVRDRSTGLMKWAQDPDELSRDAILWMINDAKLM